MAGDPIRTRAILDTNRFGDAGNPPRPMQPGKQKESSYGNQGQSLCRTLFG